MLEVLLTIAGDVPPLCPVEHLDISYLTVKCEIVAGLCEYESSESHLVLDCARTYYLEEPVGNPPRPIQVGREYLFDGDLVYLSNSMGITRISSARNIERSRANLFLSSYADAAGLDVPNTGREVGESTAYFDRDEVCSGGELAQVAPHRWSVEAGTRATTWRSWTLTDIEGVLVVEDSEVWTRGVRVSRTMNSEFRRVDGLLLPASVRREWYDGAGHVGEIRAWESIILEHASSRSSELPTRPSYVRPGTIVRDGRYSGVGSGQGECLSYKVPQPFEVLRDKWAREMHKFESKELTVLSGFGVLAGLGGALAVLSLVGKRK